jgi:NAD(P)-dependent dehydrogenase (short-subunit alcohol dehydrogenase family)
LSARTIIVTGAARGLGLTIAHALVESGSDVVCLDILPAPVEPQWSQVVQSANQRGLKLTYSHLNVTDASQVTSAFESAFASARPSHPVRGLLHCAGIQLLKDALEVEPEKFRQVIDVNLTGSFLVSQAFAREWLSKNPSANGSAGGNGASIVLIGSMSGHIANFGLENAVYNASKAGVNQLVRNLAYEWSRRGLRINVSPPPIRSHFPSPFHIVARMVQLAARADHDLPCSPFLLAT